MPEDFKDHVKWNDKISWREIINMSNEEFQVQGAAENICTTESAEKEDVSQSKENSKIKANYTIGQLKAQDLRRMINMAKNKAKEFNAMMAEAKGPKPKERVVWEVYVGRGRVSEEISKKKNCRSERFGPHEGWDFSRPADRRHFLRRLVEEEPDEVLLSPECRLWSPMQELAASRSQGAKQYLVDARKVDHDVHLTFVATVFQAQQRGGRHATIEHPWNSRAWKTRSWSRLQGYATHIDQCALGLEMEDDSGVVNPVRKPTCLFTTKQYPYEKMSRFVCDGQHAHTPLWCLALDEFQFEARGRASHSFQSEKVYAAGDGGQSSALDRMINSEDLGDEDSHHWPTVEDIIDEDPSRGEEG